MFGLAGFKAAISSKAHAVLILKQCAKRASRPEGWDYTIINGNGDYNLSNLYNVNYVNEAVKEWVKKSRLGGEK